MRYSADLTGGSLKVTESRIIADLLLSECTAEEWKTELFEKNVLQTKSIATAKRLGHLIRSRLEGVDKKLLHLIKDGSLIVATHACLAAAVKHSALLGDFLDTVIRDQYRIYSRELPINVWAEYIVACKGRDPEMPVWKESTVIRLRSSVFQILAQAGYIDSTRTRKLQTVHIAKEVLSNLKINNERYVLKCIQVVP